MGAPADSEGKRLHFHADYRISFGVAPGTMGVCVCMCVCVHTSRTLKAIMVLKPAGWNQLSHANFLKPICLFFFFYLR